MGRERDREARRDEYYSKYDNMARSYHPVSSHPLCQTASHSRYGDEDTYHYRGRRLSRHRKSSLISVGRRFSRKDSMPFNHSVRRYLNRDSSCHRHSRRSISYLRDTPPPNHYDEEPTPAPPEFDLMDKISGYEKITFEPVHASPPVQCLHEDDIQESEPDRAQIPRMPELTKQEARKALLGYVSNRYCYGKGAAKGMTINKIVNTCAFHYTLETFTESRRVGWAYVPFEGGTVDGPMNGDPPAPWDIVVPTPALFQDDTTHLTVPHTEMVRGCHSCGGMGRKKCYTCTGAGMEICFACNGDGYKPHPMIIGENEKCYQCNTTGKRKCWKCNGDSYCMCRTCNGRGQIKCFIKLTVTWMNHLDDHIAEEQTNLGEDGLMLVNGTTAFSETHSKIWPINHFPDNSINLASAQLVLKHSESFVEEQTLVQRQKVIVIPVGTVHYEWKSKQDTFVVFGLEQKVKAPDYPQKSCFSCCIL